MVGFPFGVLLGPKRSIGHHSLHWTVWESERASSKDTTHAHKDPFSGNQHLPMEVLTLFRVLSDA